MTTLIRSRKRPARPTGLSRHTVGNALVVHRTGAMSGAAKALALTVAEDPEHDLVLVDLPDGVPVALWESVAAAIPRRRRGIRLVLGGRSREAAALAGRWLSDRLGRTVIAPDGAVIPAAGGALFVHSGRGTGWVRFTPGRAPRWESARFPRPDWESPLTAELSPTSARGVAEPVPGGVWIRPAGLDQRRRGQPVDTMPARRDALTVALGAPGTPPLSLDDVARLWFQLPEPVRRSTRFVQYGPMSAPEGDTVGQALATLLGRDVAFYNGIPAGHPDTPEVRSVHPDGRLGWPVFATVLGHRPSTKDMALLEHRAPIPGLTEMAPAVYWYAPDAVVEVVPSGLLVRPPAGGAHTAAVRGAALDVRTNNLTFDPAGDATVERMRELAEDLAGRLDPATRAVTRVRPSSALLGERASVRVSGPALAPLEEPAIADAPRTVALVRPEPATPIRLESPEVPVAPVVSTVDDPVTKTAVAAGAPAPVFVRPQPIPDPEASAVLPARGLDEERAWLRKTLGAEFGTMATEVARVLSEHPGFQGALSHSPGEVLADAVAVRLYLSPHGSAIDDALRTATVGPHVPLARCVVAGLQRLPSHRGPTGILATPAPEQWAFYREHRQITEWGFLNAVTGRAANPSGDTDVLVWSITGRRTRTLEPDSGGVSERVLFVPGTAFKVLELTEPAGERRGLILLRELAESEADRDGRVPLDELALTSLRQELAAPKATEIGAAARFGRLPGLAA